MKMIRKITVLIICIFPLFSVRLSSALPLLQNYDMLSENLITEPQSLSRIKEFYLFSMERDFFFYILNGISYYPSNIISFDESLTFLAERRMLFFSIRSRTFLHFQSFRDDKNEITGAFVNIIQKSGGYFMLRVLERGALSLFFSGSADILYRKNYRDLTFGFLTGLGIYFTGFNKFLISYDIRDLGFSMRIDSSNPENVFNSFSQHLKFIYAPLKNILFIETGTAYSLFSYPALYGGIDAGFVKDKRLSNYYSLRFYYVFLDDNYILSLGTKFKWRGKKIHSDIYSLDFGFRIYINRGVSIYLNTGFMIF